MEEESVATIAGRTAASSAGRLYALAARRDWLGVLGRLLFALRDRLQSASARARAAGEHIRLTNPWHAVTIAAGEGCCPASQALKDRRFLSNEAPRLPLSDCTAPANCACVYKHYSDRRDGPRRAEEQDVYERGYTAASATPKAERRGSRGRRATDGH